MAEGKRGAPKGNQNNHKGRRFASIIEKRIEELKKMDALADVLIEKALDGDIQALKEIADRLDGKAKQTQDITVTTPSVNLDFKG